MYISQGPVTIQVQVPSAGDKPEWRLNGQTVSLSLALTDSVTTLKLKLQDETGMPPAKQKISYDVRQLDSYNLDPFRLHTVFFYRECFSRTTIQLHFTTC